MPAIMALGNLRIGPIFGTQMSALWRLGRVEGMNGYETLRGGLGTIADLEVELDKRVRHSYSLSTIKCRLSIIGIGLRKQISLDSYRIRASFTQSINARAMQKLVRFHQVRL